MTGIEHGRALLKQWKIVLGVLAVALAAGGALLLLLPRQYSSSATLYVSTQNGNANTSSAYQGSLLSAQRVKSYIELASSERVLGSVVAVAGDGSTVEDLRDRLTISTAPDTVLVTVAMTARAPEDSARLTDAVMTSLIEVISEVEQSSERGQPPAVMVRVVQPAVTDPNPVWPSERVFLAVAVVLGSAAGVGLAEVRRRLDDTVKSAAELARVSDLPALGTTLQDASVEQNPLVVAADPLGRSAEEYRKLRTNLEYVDVDSPPKSILITSAFPGEGKTTTIANIAISLALSGRGVVVVDGDLRKPRLAEVFGVEGAVGLSTVLAGRTRVRDAIQTASSNVDVLASGSVPPNPAELLGSQQMQAVLLELSEVYDHVLIDAPPALLVTDAAAVAPNADGVVLIVRHATTSPSRIAEAIESMRNVSGRLLGAVLTCAPPSKDKRYGTYGYYGEGARDRRDLAQGPAVRPVERARRRAEGMARPRHDESAVTRPQPRPRARPNM